MEPTEAQIAYLKRFDAYLQYLISVGALTETEYQTQHNQVVDSMQGLGGLGSGALKDQPVTDVTKLPSYYKVQTWSKQQGEKKIKEWEDKNAEINRFNEDAYADYLQSKKYREDFQAAEKVRDKREWEMAQTRAATAKQELGTYNKRVLPYLEAQQTLQAGAGKFAEESKRDRETYARAQPQIPPLEGLESKFFSFLEGMPSSSKRYWEQRLGTVAQKFGAEGRKARSDWWTQQHTPVLVPQVGEEPRTMGITQFKGTYGTSQKATEQLAAGSSMEGFGALTSGQRADVEALRASSGGAEIPTYRLPAERPDPWASFVEKYPFLEEFKMLPSRERGVYEPQYRPPTRWLNY